MRATTTEGLTPPRLPFELRIIYNEAEKLVLHANIESVK
jgi:hypothetical protein